MAICPNCGREIPEDALICPYCGASLYPQTRYGGWYYGQMTSPPKKDGRFWKGFLVGFIIAFLLAAGILSAIYIIPMSQKIDELQKKYDDLSLKYDSLVLKYNQLNESYVEKVREYDELLAKYIALTNYSDEKFIVLLFFSTDYGQNKYWLYLEIDPFVYIEYKMKKHYPGTMEYADKFTEYITTDGVMNTIVNAVKSKVTTYSDEELADALLSIVQNKNYISGHVLDEPGVYDNVSNENIGTFYYTDIPAKYPVETLVMHGGECLDDAIFYASLLKTAGFSGALLLLPTISHAMVGVNLYSPPQHNTQQPHYWYVEHNGIVYYTAETTGYGWLVGDCPEEAQNVPVSVYPFSP